MFRAGKNDRMQNVSMYCIFKHRLYYRFHMLINKFLAELFITSFYKIVNNALGFGMLKTHRYQGTQTDSTRHNQPINQY